MFGETKHDAVSIGLASLDGTGVIPVAGDGATFSFAAGVTQDSPSERWWPGWPRTLLGLAAAVWLVAGLTGIPGLILAACRYETQRRGRTGRLSRATPQS
ncbi:MAG TPA: hypothetical protein VLL30_23985 [Reyranella sp.]|nr:hypothetical protein [Reyranella sp.]